MPDNFAVKQVRKGAQRLPKKERIAEIYHAAARVFREKGYEAASLNDLARATGLTKAGLYHYISSKEALLFEIMNYGMDLVETDVIIPANAVTDPQDRLRTLVRAYVELVMTNTTMTVIINEANGLSPVLRQKIRVRRQIFSHFVHDTIQQIKDAGIAEVRDVGITTLNFVGSLVWLAYWYRPDGRLTKKEVIEEIEALLVDRMVGLGLSTANANSTHRTGSP